jgi:hypothetical protein
MAPQSIRKRDHRHIKLGDHTHMAHDLTGKIPVRISNELLTSDESAVAHIAHESFELGNFEAEGQWTQRFYIQQTAAPSQGGLQASWHSQAWDYADQIVLKMRGQ